MPPAQRRLTDICLMPAALSTATRRIGAEARFGLHAALQLDAGDMSRCRGASVSKRDDCYVMSHASVSPKSIRRRSASLIFFTAPKVRTRGCRGCFNADGS